MTMIRNLAFALALGAVAAPEAGAQAQARTDERGEPLVQVVTTQDAGTARRTELALRLIRVGVGANFAKSLEAMVTTEMADLEAKGAPPEEAAWFRANAPRMLNAMVEGLITDLAPVYADVFTTEELQAQIAFYETPIGRQISSKTLQMSVASQPLLEQRLQGFAVELMTKYCAQFDCDAAATPAAPAAKGRR